MTARHAYVHVPFCERKCPYCDFNSHAGRDDEQGAYVDALLVEARRLGHGANPVTIYVGGGTPTHLGAPELARLLDGLRDVLGDARLEEFTVEANPGTVDAEKVRVLRDAGVHRVSLGAQSFDDRHLRTLGRIHDAADTSRSATLIRDGGIGRLSLDLILATPGQTLAEQQEDLERVLALEPEHVSAYVLTIEEGTVFERHVRTGTMAAPIPERDLQHLHLAIEVLGKAGVRRYEVSNFAEPGAESRHNLAYWTDEAWLGLGAGAHAHARGVRSKNLDDPAAYIRSIATRGHAREWSEHAPPTVQAFEALMMGLRLLRGADLDCIRERSGIDLRATHGDVIEGHMRVGLLVLENERLRATHRGLDVLSRILEDFVPETDTWVEAETSP